jgi:N-acetylglucosamine kinase-like BadF-type ATPase
VTPDPLPSSPLIIGVDGGGTKTVAWLAPLDDTTNTVVLGRGLAGPGNPRSAGFDVAQGNIALAVQSAFDDAAVPRQTVAAACFGLAGAGRADEQQRIATWAKEFGIATRVQVTGDAEPILAAASPENVGVALIAGTGSFAWGRNAAGETARSGGWGYLLGDEGSGYAIALAGLRAAVCAADKRGPQTALLPAFMDKLGVTSPQELVAKVYAPEMSRERLADLASVVFDLRRADQSAEQIIQSAATGLAEMVATVAANLQLPFNNYDLAAAGGVFLHQKPYLEQVFQWLLANRESAPARWLLVEEPVAGAVTLARRLAPS